MAPKQCTLCATPRPVLIRCQIDATGTWHFVCPGKCWHSVSGGVEDARGLEGKYPGYRYGGMWKDRDADGPLSAKKPRKVKERQKKDAEERRAAETNAEAETKAEAEGKESVQAGESSD